MATISTVARLVIVNGSATTSERVTHAAAAAGPGYAAPIPPESLRSECITRIPLVTSSTAPA
jgi:hypothetical protein